MPENKLIWATLRSPVFFYPKEVFSVNRFKSITATLLIGVLLIGIVYLWQHRSLGTVSREDIIDHLALSHAPGEFADWYSGAHADGPNLCLHIRAGYTVYTDEDKLRLQGLRYDADSQTLYDDISGKVYTGVSSDKYSSLSRPLKFAAEPKGYTMNEVVELYTLIENSSLSLFDTYPEIFSVGYNSSGVYFRLRHDAADPKTTMRLILAQYPKYAHCIHFDEERWLSLGHKNSQ